MPSRDWRERFLTLAPPDPGDVAVLRRGAKVFGVELSPTRIRRYAAAMRAGAQPEDALNHIAYSSARIRAVLARHGEATADNRGFLRGIFLELLGREPEPDAYAHFDAELRDGRTREDVVRTVINSEEGMRITGLRVAHAVLRSDLTLEGPDRYVVEPTDASAMWFRARTVDDFAWLSDRVVGDDVVQPEIEVQRDDRVLAQIVAAFAPRQGIHIATRPTGVTLALEELDVEVAQTAPHALASSPGAADVVFGFDGFEAMAPGAVADVVEELGRCVVEGGFVVVGVATFDRPVGDASTARDLGPDGLWMAVPVDALGHPIGGRLTWATEGWWDATFGLAGFTRVRAVERRVHERYGRWMRDEVPDELALLVYGRAPDPDVVAEVAARVHDIPARAGI